MKRTPQLYLPPSGATTWTACTEQPWMVLENQDDLPTNLDTDASIEGTLAHDLGENALRGTKLPTKGVNADMREYVQGYVDYCQFLAMGCDEQHVELKLPLFYMPERNGKIDFTTFTKLSRSQWMVDIVDLKYGKWKVDAVSNKQLAIYARNVILKFKVPLDSIIGIHIYQPRVGEEEMPYSTWTMTGHEVIAWTEEHIAKPAKVIQTRKGTKFAPSDAACHFCPCATFCPARAADLFSAQDAFELTPVEPAATAIEVADLPKEKLLAMLPHVDGIIKFCKAVKKHARDFALRGNIAEEDGWKLVAGKGRRSWTDESDAEEFMLEQGFKISDLHPSKLVSPKKAEDLLKAAKKSGLKKTLSKLIARSDGPPSFVPASDKRTTWTPAHTLSAEDIIALSDGLEED